VVMRHARNELEGGSSSVIDIALGCGYSDNSAFTKAYRRFWSESPRETRVRATE